MAVSKFSSAAGGNDFNINVGSAYSVINFTQEYAAGSYSFTSAQLDTTMDVYAYNAQGTLVGYTNGKGLTTNGGFIKMVILGGTVGDVLSFSYKTTYYAVAETNEILAGPVILSTTPTSLPNVNSSTTVTGLNFATDVAVTFTGTDNLARPAKSVVRGSVNSLVVTRPDTLPSSYNPYAMTATNPSVAYQPTGSGANTISVTAGVNPVWVTAAGYNPVAVSPTNATFTFLATDPDGGSTITYSIVSGALPSGATLNTSTGVLTFSGFPTSNLTLTVRATDSGNSTADLTTTLLVPVATGGTITTSGNYKIHVFSGSGTFTPNFTGTVEVIMVGGGGGGSNIIGGGGGAGGLIASTTTLATAAAYPIVVGAGGRGGYGYNALGYTGSGDHGGSTTFNNLIAYGGGGALGWSAINQGITPADALTLTAGGSGAGGSANMQISSSYPAGGQLAGQAQQASSASGGYGNNGGVGGDDAAANREIGGGGGGAGSAGTTGYNSSGNGGAGLYTALTDSIGAAANIGVLSSSHYYFAGGGGAGRRYQTSGNGPSSGGIGGGGNGASGSGGGSSGTDGTGGGGGGGNYPNAISSSSIAGGYGGNGIVAIRYRFQ
jgi:hypothetical protein